MKELNREEYLNLYEPSAREIVVRQMDNPDTIAHVYFECQQLDSTQLGCSSGLPVGPGWMTLKTLEDTGSFADGKANGQLGKPLGTTPSNFQYPTFYWLK